MLCIEYNIITGRKVLENDHHHQQATFSLLHLLLILLLITVFKTQPIISLRKNREESC